MSEEFLLLSKIAINTKYISHIIINDDKFIIKLSKQSDICPYEQRMLAIYKDDAPDDFKKINSWLQ